MSVFVDTSAFIAMADADNVQHEEALRLWEALGASGEPLFATNYVLVETFSLLQRRLGIQAVREFQESVCPLLSVQWIDEPMHRAGVTAVLAAGRRQLSLVDCVSFEVMRRIGLNRVFCFDPHFEEQGFEAVR